MRWGIQNESANNHGEVATCLKEIELCKKYSVATNFVVRSRLSISHRSRSSDALGSVESPVWFSAHPSADSSDPFRIVKIDRCHRVQRGKGR